jgi:hypothetical protein
MIPVLILLFGAAAIFTAALCFPRLGQETFRKAEAVLARTAGNRHMWLGIIAGYLLFSFLLLVPLKLPQPAVADEFSYLLAADTFAHGRLANPAHPFWQHFESLHILQQPAYISKYPPAQGMFLALGQLVWKPILGVWISTALAGAAIFWMLAGVFRKSWALLGAVLILANPQVLFWNWRYWGGAVALMGGALLMGGFWRNLKMPSVKNSLASGLGMGILSLSRPFEGAVFSALVMGLCIYFVWKKAGPAALAGRVLVPVVCVLLPFLAFQLVYDSRTTGDPLRMPYVVYEQTYNPIPIFLCQKARPLPAYDNPEMEKSYVADFKQWNLEHTFPGFFKVLAHKLALFKAYSWNLLFLVLLLPLPALWRRGGNVRMVLVLAGVMALIYFGATVWTLPHYTAPAMPLVAILACAGLRELRTWRFKGRRFGLPAARWLAVYICLSSVVVFVVREIQHRNAWQFQRQSLQARLEGDGQKHLVIVRYGPKHDPEIEWVYNRADIDGSPVVWARDMGDAENQKLMDYFKGYQVTVVEPDKLKRFKE